MHASINIHVDAQTKFEASFVALNRRVIQIDGKGGDFNIFVTDEKARELAEAILAALPAKTALALVADEREAV
jgi:hypothetical protein